MTNPIYAIGDIHGHLDQLETALGRIHSDGGPDAEIVFLGDYIDRGPSSAQVLDLLIQAQAKNRPWTMLKGNHDAYLPLFLNDGNAFGSRGRPGTPWFDPILGGDTTMASYGLRVQNRAPQDILAEARAAVPQAHIDFIENLPVFHQTDHLAFAHAGIRPGIPFEAQTEIDLTWIRKEFLEDPRDHGKLIIHGHTARPYPEHHGNRVNLDGGTGWGRELFPAAFEGSDVWLLTATGREKLVPNPA
ncbi:metallophosphoesterase family protein [Cognatishimia sp. WU-CL00825]|uniref:metallophosphoesterase family protein n=1 Tax=Cognatishimia sp. WU-CL00825 TaxID=3127658 RepID=UPI003365770A